MAFARASAPRGLRSLKAEDLDRKFDSGADITEHLDLSRARRPEKEQKRDTVDTPNSTCVVDN